MLGALDVRGALKMRKTWLVPFGSSLYLGRQTWGRELQGTVMEAVVQTLYSVL